MTVSDVRSAFTSDQFPGTKRAWWVLAEVISLAHEGVERVAYELDHWANLAMARSEQFDGSACAPMTPKSLETLAPITPQPSIFPSHSATSDGAG